MTRDRWQIVPIRDEALGLAIDSANNVYVSGQGTDRLFKIATLPACI